MELRSLPLSQRLLASWFLVAIAAGFVAAQVNLRLQHEAADGEPGLSYSDVVAAFHGRPGASLLTSKISPGGSMAEHLPSATDRDVIWRWVASGAAKSEFAPVSEILSRRCIRCHNPGGKMRQVPFAESREQAPVYELVQPLTAANTGMSWASLAKSSHAHLFGLATLFAVAGWVFLGTRAPERLKAAAVSLPFAALLIDVGSWWLTKLHAAFAAGIVAAGALMGVAFAVLIAWPLWEMWGPRRRPSSAGQARAESDLPKQGDRS